MRSYCLMVRKFPFRIMGNFQRWMVAMVAQKYESILLLNGILKKCQNGKSFVMYILAQFFKSTSTHYNFSHFMELEFSQQTAKTVAKGARPFLPFMIQFTPPELLAHIQPFLSLTGTQTANVHQNPFPFPSGHTVRLDF